MAKSMFKFLAAFMLTFYTAMVGWYALVHMAPGVTAEVFIALCAMFAAYVFYTFLPGKLRFIMPIPPVAAFLTGAAYYKMLALITGKEPQVTGIVILIVAASLTVFFVKKRKRARRHSDAWLYALLPEDCTVYKEVYLPDGHIDSEYPRKADFVIAKGLGVYALFLADGRDRGRYTKKTAEAAGVFALALDAYLRPKAPDVMVIAVAVDLTGNNSQEADLIPTEDISGLLESSQPAPKRMQEEAIHKWLTSVSFKHRHAGGKGAAVRMRAAKEHKGD